MISVARAGRTRSSRLLLLFTTTERRHLRRARPRATATRCRRSAWPSTAPRTTAASPTRRERASERGHVRRLVRRRLTRRAARRRTHEAPCQRLLRLSTTVPRASSPPRAATTLSPILPTPRIIQRLTQLARVAIACAQFTLNANCPHLSNELGTLSMVNCGQPNTGGSQFVRSSLGAPLARRWSPDTDSGRRLRQPHQLTRAPAAVARVAPRPPPLSRPSCSHHRCAPVAWLGSTWLERSDRDDGVCVCAQFINLVHNNFLDWWDHTQQCRSSHPVFARVVGGQDVVQRIGQAATNTRDQPDPPICVTRIARKRNDAKTTAIAPPTTADAPPPPPPPPEPPTSTTSPV